MGGGEKKGGYLRAITPEEAVYTYPSKSDAVTMGKRRSVLLLDVIDRVYSNTIRQIGMQRLENSDDANRLTLQSIVQYLSNLLQLEHYFMPIQDNTKETQVMNEVAAKFVSLLACLNQDGGDSYPCLMSGILYNMLEGFVRRDLSSQILILLLEEEKGIEWKDINNKHILLFDHKNKLWDVQNLSQHKKLSPQSQSSWQELFQKYFKDDHVRGQQFHAFLKLLEDKQPKKENARQRYERLFRLVPKYVLIRRPGEDNFIIDN
ncbi:hypothetical protein RFI_15056 [Reticulomyxa filosa]|uniref:Uncharacterized protein n=1 Tax=Reticulomyxa filosa TaxID=46433 RepID=X6NA14_RETFI|nr:hypothetical protein RFI_15056 [Reticulomyxa filosa]|eukprot:ETO22147.1 hypothetical protein RFI_15056 [Reticulomyxa filosa]